MYYGSVHSHHTVHDTSESVHCQWTQKNLKIAAALWQQQLRARKSAVSEFSPWWGFIFRWNDSIDLVLAQFIAGDYQFSPIRRTHFKDEIVKLWCYQDRLILSLLLQLIKPTFKHIISSRCMHLAGPSQVKPAITQIRAALANDFQYMIRTDIKSYYASINHDILINQVEENFDDPRVLQYLKDIITVAVDDEGILSLPTQGIPLRSSLSPFFAALYLSPLDCAFEKRKGVFYLRFNDDILILFKTKKQYQRGKKRMFSILNDLKLNVASHKTKMGQLNDFHFLGVQFGVSQNRQKEFQVTVGLHPRSCQRALDRVKVMRFDAVDPDTQHRTIEI